MANKLLKHFGFSGKKVSSQQSPSREYSSKTANNIQELHARTPTKTRSSTNVISRGCTSSSAADPHVRPEADARRHSDASTVRGSLPGARGAARHRGGGSPGGVGWTMSRNDSDLRAPDSATISSSSVRSRQTAGAEIVTQDDLRRSYDHTDLGCPVRLEVTSISSDNLTVCTS